MKKEKKSKIFIDEISSIILVFGLGLVAYYFFEKYIKI